MLTRRQFLTQSSLLSGSCLSLPRAFAVGDGKTKGKQTSLGTLDSDAIRHVKDLTRGQTITLKLLYPDGSLPNIQPLVERFTEQTGVKFELIKIGVDDINSTMVLKAALEEYFCDIALPATFGMTDLANANALQPLTSYSEQYEPSDYKDYQLYDYGNYVDGEFYGYQTDGDTYLMFYNQDFLEDADYQKSFLQEYGYPLDIPQTWAQLDDMIRFFHKPDDNQYGGCLFRTPGYGAWEWWSRFHAKGYFPLDDNVSPQINNAAGVEALQELIDVSEFLHPKAASDGLFENWATFAAGETFCNIGWGGTQKYLNSSKSQVKGKLVFSPAPGGIVEGQTIPNCPIFNWGWNYVVSAQCPHPEIAYLFTLFACSPVMSTIAVQNNGFFDPFREEHYNNVDIQQAYSTEFLDAHKQSMRDSIPDFYVRNQSAYLSSLQENIHLAYEGALTAKEALDVTATQWQLLTAKVGKVEQQRTWLALKARYPEALRAILK